MHDGRTRRSNMHNRSQIHTGKGQGEKPLRKTLLRSLQKMEAEHTSRFAFIKNRVDYSTFTTGAPFCLADCYGDAVPADSSRKGIPSTRRSYTLQSVT